MKKTRLITAFLTAVTAASMLAVNASAVYIPEGFTPVYDITPYVEGEIVSEKIDLGDGYGEIHKYYVGKNGEKITGRSLLYIDYSFDTAIGADMRMVNVDKKTGEIKGAYTGFTKNKSGRRYYLRGERIYGWYKVGNYWYHFDENGYADTDRTKICGAWYTFDKNGKWTGKVSINGLAPVDFKLYVEDIHGMSGYGTDGYVYYGMDYDGKEHTKNIEFSVRDRQIMYCMFLESGISEGKETKYNDIYKFCGKYASGEGTEHLEIWETEPAFGYEVTVTCGGKTTKLVFDDSCGQFSHLDEGCFNAEVFTDNLQSYRRNQLYKKYPRPEGVDWVTIE